MRSRLYTCQVMHARFHPRRHRFAYGIFLFAIDLDELDTLDRRLRWFSVGRRNLYRFDEADYLPVHEPAHNPEPGQPVAVSRPGARLKQRVLDLLRARGHDADRVARVELLTLPRVFGYLFNPVSFYFCHDAEGRCVATFAEVTNTFREIKTYVLGPDARREEDSRLAPEVFRARVPKHFYVSPFSDVDVAFDFALRPPGERLALQIDDYEGERRTLTSTLTGRSEPLTDARLAGLTLRHPLLSLKIISLIHWHALRLFLKKIPWFPKAARAADQRHLLRPHTSLAPRAAAPSPPAI